MDDNMGNTKNLWFEGHFNQDTFNKLTKENLFKESHATYVALEKYDDGYLGQDKTLPYALGIFHSSDMVENDVMNFIVGLMNVGTIGYSYENYPYRAIYRINDENREPWFGN